MNESEVDHALLSAMRHLMNDLSLGDRFATNIVLSEDVFDRYVKICDEKYGPDHRGLVCQFMGRDVIVVPGVELLGCVRVLR